MSRGAVIVAAFLAAAPSLACAPVPGEGRFVRIQAEEALIIWDEAAQRQHFIRRAAFDTDAKDFGFLVPTPSRPELAEAEDVLFPELASITARGAKMAAAAPSRGKSASAVTVLEQKVVSGFDAAVLEATDARALDAWLKQHGYPSSPELVDWYRPYVDARWKITAFKIAGEARTVTTKPVRMSFQTERPFFPYREPVAKTGAKERLLRVYFLADARFEASIGSKGAWPGRTVWSKEIADEDRLKVLKLAGLPMMAGGGGKRLTQLEDRSSVRAGNDELFFARAADQSTLEPSEQGIDLAQMGEEVVALAPLLVQTRVGLVIIAIVVLLLAGISYAGWRLFRRFF